jgi:hypothetical protein
MARLKWRSPIEAGKRGFADWISELRGRGLNGVYLIRDARTRQVLYIGESHTGRLHETMTRHLWAWNGKGAGPSYRPEFVELAVVVAETPLDDPVADQYALIQEHSPPDNFMDGHTLWWRMVTRRPKGVAHGTR